MIMIAQLFYAEAVVGFGLSCHLSLPQPNNAGDIHMQFCRPAVYLIQQTSESDNCFGEIKTTTSYKSFQTLEVIF